MKNPYRVKGWIPCAAQFVALLAFMTSLNGQTPDGAQPESGTKTVPADSPSTSDPVVVSALEILRDECISCHKPGKTKGGLRLNTADGLKAGGESGPVIKPNRSAESLLYSVLLQEGDPHMPPKKQLTPSQIQALGKWIDSGAHWDDTVMEQPPKVAPVELKPLPASIKPVLSIAFSPDGTRVCISRGGEVQVRDAKQPKFPIQISFSAHQEIVGSVAWSPDGGKLATGGFRRVRFWQSADGAADGEISEGLVGEVTSLVWEKSGENVWIADSLASRAGFIHQLALPSRKWGRTWKAHEDSVYGMALSADGKWLASAGADKLARRWEIKSGNLAATYEGHTNQVLGVAFDPILPRIATIGADREFKIWDSESREQDAVLGDKKQVFAALGWSRDSTKDGSRLAAVTDRGSGSVFSAIQKHTGAQRSDTAKEQKLEKVDAVLQCVALSPDGTQVIAGASDGRTFAWSAADGKLLPIE